MTDTVNANEKTSMTITSQLLDIDGVAVPGSVLDVMMITIHHFNDRSLRIRSSDDVLSDSRITIDESGLLNWEVRPYETQIIQPDLVAFGRNEKHRAVFEFMYESASVGVLNNPFSTVEGSKTITVNHPSHGLLVRDNVYYIGTEDVGGLDIGGQYIVRTVIDPDTYTITHFDDATSTEIDGGGLPDWYANGKSGSAEVLMNIKRFDPV